MDGQMIRRTSEHRCVRSEGLDGPVTATCRGRDELAGRTIAEAALDVEVDFGDGRIRSISDLPELVGRTAYSGFRQAAADLLPDERAAHTVRYQLLDDLPIALLLSGRVLRVEGIALGEPDRKPPVDVCAGWVGGGTLIQGFTDQGPPLHTGPRVQADDPPPPLSTRRRRTLDVWIDDGIGRLAAWFCDSHVDRDGIETVVHEYRVEASVDLATRRFVEAEARPGTLPAPECPTAAASAGRLVGRPIEGTRDWVAGELTGPSTCTHLNDQLRSLDDAGALFDALGQDGNS